MLQVLPELGPAPDPDSLICKLKNNTNSNRYNTFGIFCFRNLYFLNRILPIQVSDQILRIQLPGRTLVEQLK